MAFKDFRLKIISRVLGLSFSIFAMFYLVFSGTYITAGFVLGVVVYQVVSVINLLENTNKELIDFLSSIRYDDFSQSYKLTGRGGSFDELNFEFNKVIQNFKNIRAEKEAEYQYLKNIIHHIGIGILSFDKKGDVQIINTAAKRLFKVNRLRNISKLKDFSGELVEHFNKLRTGSKALVRIRDNGEIVQLAIYAIELYLKGEEYKLVTVQNIQSELEEKEMEAWQNLIRVLTHEIMNSVTPISSLANTIEGEVNYIKENEEPNLSTEDLEDISLAVGTIKRRSEALIRFVNDFRNLTHMPEPNLNHVRVSDIFRHIKILMDHECEEHEIRFETQLEPESLIVTADQEMIEQVLINMIKNAVQALQELTKEENSNKVIILLGQQNQNNRPVISVKDNGPGIDKDALDRIFIPFFTTKKMGSGIGLSLSRQIMRLHKGTITASSDPGQGTTFNLVF
ncbi:sensor histidine kinase [Flexithrix dorotheae]|uniref:sensor histidine kinase n=1 Tax=Flexithrix dorotheae TaxID=70993 RepID=UPI000377519B|nr:ATP-binding protein [Flexithrix dorotheae]